MSICIAGQFAELYPVAMNLPHQQLGTGPHLLVFFPGLTDCFRDPSAAARQLELTFRPVLQEFTVLSVGRRQPLNSGTTLQDMAEDYFAFLKSYCKDTRPFAIAGVSMGGMIAQYLMARYPELTDRLFLLATAGSQPAESAVRLSHWLHLAEKSEFQKLWDEALDVMIASSNRLAAVRPVLEVPRQPDFSTSVRACLDHDAREFLGNIIAEVTVVYGEKDPLFHPYIVSEMKQYLHQARFKAVPDGHHGLTGPLRNAFLDSLKESLP